MKDDPVERDYSFLKDWTEPRNSAEEYSQYIHALEARLVAAERVVEAARQAQSFMPATCEHAEAFARHPDNIWCAARHRHVIVDALIAYEKAYKVEPPTLHSGSVAQSPGAHSSDLNSVVSEEK